MEKFFKILFALVLLISGDLTAQNTKGLSTRVENLIFQYGVKGGLQYSWTRLDDPTQQGVVSNNPVLGFNVGLVAAFEVKKRYFLHTELLYSTKGKNVQGIADPSLENRVTYRYIDLPMLYNIQFKKTVNSATLKQFKWYIGAGPIFSYWLGGSGTVNNSELEENGLPAIDYKIKFGSRGDDLREINAVYVSDANRLQVGFNLGGGILLEPLSGRKIMIDARLEIGHSWLGKKNSTDYVLPATYKDNLQSSNMGLRLSCAYLFEKNLAKKVRNLGKTRSNKKPKY
jgi:hypothetical protein